MKKKEMFIVAILVVIISGALIGYIISLILNENACRWIISGIVIAIISNVCSGLVASKSCGKKKDN